MNAHDKIGFLFLLGAIAILLLPLYVSEEVVEKHFFKLPGVLFLYTIIFVYFL